jgi:stress-induced morphogen
LTYYSAAASRRRRRKRFNVSRQQIMTEPMQHVNAQMLQDRLREYLQSDQVEVLDISGGCGSSFEVYAVSDMFEGKRLLQRHKLVNEGIGQSLMAEIHALSIKKTKTVAEEGGL